MITLFLIAIFAFTIFQSAPIVSADLPENIGDGPYIDNIVYKVIANQNQRVLALLAGEIEMDSTYFDTYYTTPDHLASLNADPDIDIAQTLQNGYTYASFDCEQYPGNISGFRRAFAYAFNKTKIVNEILNGYAEVHDSVVPSQNPFCIEDELDLYYYTAQPDIGNAILDDLGFIINSTTGVRDAPNGDPVHILILYGMGSERLGYIADVCIEAFASLNISASSTAPCNCELNQEMTIWGQQFYDSDLRWLAHQFWSECPEDYYYSPTGFRNSTFDSWRDQLLNSPSYEETFEAASEMQKILHYNVPLIPIYQDIWLHPYRNDQFDGHIEDTANSVHGPWTMLNIGRVDGSYGGTVPVAISNEPIFNFWRTGATSGNWFYTIMHCALYTKDPDQQPYPQLAESVNIETHSDNPSVIEGNTRFTFEVREGFEWSDGVPVTSEDVLFTFNFILESSEFGNRAGDSLIELSALYSPRPSVVVLEFSTESYWLFQGFAYNFIVPKHVFETYEPEEWADWDLITTDEGSSLNCGPFELTDSEEGEFYELTARYRNYFRPPGTWVALLQPMYDTQVMFPSFTLRWDLEWDLHLFENEVAEEGRFDLEFQYAFTSYSYKVFFDGENYSEGTSDSYNFVDVNIEKPLLAAGLHNVTLVLDNGYYAPQIDTVMVTIEIPFSPTTLISVVSVSVIAIVGLTILWNTKLRRFQPQRFAV